MSEEKDQKIAKIFENTLNMHGYGFHYAVVQRAVELFEDSKSVWQFEVAEFPTEVQGRGTRIDFILKRTPNRLFGPGEPLYLLAECKRANPALSNWCFIKAPFTYRNPSRKLFLEKVRLDESKKLTSYSASTKENENIYHIGLEVKADKKGDPVGSTRGAIEGAVTQVLRGLNGMVNFLATNPQMFGKREQLFLLPAIFTTAELWVTNADLSSADLESGETDLRSAGCIQVDWLLYQYNTSPGLKHSFSSEEHSSSLSEVLQSEYIRTVPIVSPRGIKVFFKWAGDQDLEYV